MCCISSFKSCVLPPAHLTKGVAAQAKGGASFGVGSTMAMGALLQREALVWPAPSGRKLTIVLDLCTTHGSMEKPMLTRGFCVRCRSSSACKRLPDCEFLSITDDGTVSVTLGRKLSSEEVRRLRTTGQMLAEVEQAARGDALFAIAFGYTVGDFSRLDEDEWADSPRGAPLFGSVTETLSLR